MVFCDWSAMNRQAQRSVDEALARSANETNELSVTFMSDRWDGRWRCAYCADRRPHVHHTTNTCQISQVDHSPDR